MANQNDIKQSLASSVTYKREWYADEYIGSADALISAGIIGPHQIPGTPGMGRIQCTFFQDGTRLTNGKRRKPGAKTIIKMAGKQYKVEILVSDEEFERRQRESERATDSTKCSEDEEDVNIEFQRFIWKVLLGTKRPQKRT